MKKIAIVLLAALMLLAISCDEKPQHEHKFSEEWQSNETQHWHECECQEKSGVADHDYETITVESTCSKKGSETVKCKVCGYVKSTKELELKAHTPAEEHVITDSTCSEEGSDVVKCTVCGEVVSSKVIEKKEHTPEEEHVIVAPSCSEFGSDSTVCSVCGETISVVFSAKLDHTPSETPEEVKGPSCSEEGLSVVKCTVCNEVISSTPIACIPHTWGDWVTDEESGLQTRTCSECDATETSGSKPLTAEVMNVAVVYDRLIDEVSSNVIETIHLSDTSIFSSFDGILYDLKNVLLDGDVNTFEVKSHDEEKYHTYRIEFDEEGDPSSIIIDGVPVGDVSDPMSDKYLCAFGSYMMSVEEVSRQCNKMVDVEVTYSENTYILNFESEYDASKAYETRYMKITDSEGDIKLEYSLNCVGPKAKNSSIYNLASNRIITEAKAVGMFTVDGVSYDIDSVNKVIADMFK